jgi:hypothetical protein
MTDVAPPAPTVFRATRRARLLVLLAYLPMLLLVVPFGILTALFPPVLPMLIVVLVAAVAAVVYGILSAVRTRVEFGDGAYRQVFALVDRRFTVADIGKVMPIEALDYGLQSAAHLVVVDRNGRRLLLLNDQIVPREQMEVLVNDMIGRGAPLEHVPGRVTIAQFARAHPGALPPQLAHRVRFLLLVALGTLLVLGVAAAVSVAGVIASFAS